MRTQLPQVRCEWISWPYGHNDAIAGRFSDTIAAIERTTRQLESICNRFQPDFVIGIPGFQSSFLCEHLKVPHVAVLHGPWLTPEYDLSDLSPGELAVFRAWERSIQVTDTMTRILAHAMGRHYRGYRHWLDSQHAVVAQAFDVAYRRTRLSIGFLHSDFGPHSVEGLPAGCLAISFGTAVKKISPEILRQVRELRLPLIAIGGGGTADSGVLHVSAVAGSRLAEVAAVAVTHGGIGTIPVFAQAGAPQVYVPHEVDGAINSILATRSGWGKVIPLSHWLIRGPFGRVSPPMEQGVLTDLCRSALQIAPPAFPAFDSSQVGVQFASFR